MQIICIHANVYNQTYKHVQMPKVIIHKTITNKCIIQTCKYNLRIHVKKLEIYIRKL